MATVYVKQANRRDYQSTEDWEQAQHANFEAALKKFKKDVIREGDLKRYRDNMYYTSKSEKEKAKKKAGRRKQLRKMWLDKKYNKD